MTPQIVFHLTSCLKQYQDADHLSKASPQLNKIVGRSLSGSVSSELQERHPSIYFDLNIYGAPVLQTGGQKHKRFRHKGDIISGLDDGALTCKGSMNPITTHSYSGYQ